MCLGVQRQLEGRRGRLRQFQWGVGWAGSWGLQGGGRIWGSL